MIVLLIELKNFQVLQADGSAMAASVNAATLALADAGIALKGDSALYIYVLRDVALNFIYLCYLPLTLLFIY